MGSNLESVDTASGVKMPRNDPYTGYEVAIYDPQLRIHNPFVIFPSPLVICHRESVGPLDEFRNAITDTDA
jgi:hypothetical protein